MRGRRNAPRFPEHEVEARPASGRPRGQEARAALIGAARQVFERDGFLGARITDIAAAAGVATGSFYTHFRDKDEVFAVLMEQTYEQLFQSGTLQMGQEADPAAKIEQAVRAYLDTYRRHARLRKLMEEVANLDGRFFQILMRRSLATAERNAADIRALQERGLADPHLDPDLASLALGAMGSRFAYTVFCGELGYGADFEGLVSTLTRLWVNGIGVTTGAGGGQPGSSSSR